jgi:hypothetical protein
LAGQKKVQKQLTAVENRLAICREYTRLWQEYFKYFSDGFEGKKIYDKDEQSFFQLMNVLALNHYRFAEMAAELMKDSEGVLKVLCDTPSLQTIAQMSEAQYSKLLIDWHTLFIAMNKAIGKLNVMMPPPEQPRGGKAKQAA